MAIRQNTALFALLGVTFGGDGTVTFALPNFQSRVPAGSGQGPGRSPYLPGTMIGTESETLQTTQVPPHTHQLMATSVQATQSAAGGEQFATSIKGSFQSSTQARIYSTGAPNTPINSASILPAGGGGPHSNVMPYMTLNFCISLQGVYPQRP